MEEYEHEQQVNESLLDTDMGRKGGSKCWQNEDDCPNRAKKILDESHSSSS